MGGSSHAVGRVHGTPSRFGGLVSVACGYFWARVDEISTRAPLRVDRAIPAVRARFDQTPKGEDSRALRILAGLGYRQLTSASEAELWEALGLVVAMIFHRVLKTLKRSESGWLKLMPMPI